MLFSNHINAMKVAEGDRRIYVLHNAKTPASPEYFIKLHEWLDKDDGAWARAVWRWLRQRPVNVADLVKPPEMNKAKRDMINASKQSTDIAVEAVLNNWPCDLIVPYQVKDILAEFKRKYMETGNDRNNNTILGHRISDNCQTIEVYKDGDSGDTGPLKFDGNSRTVSVIKSKLTDKNNWLTAAPITRLQARDNLTKPTPEQKADILAAVADALTAYNF